MRMCAQSNGDPLASVQLSPSGRTTLMRGGVICKREVDTSEGEYSLRFTFCEIFQIHAAKAMFYLAKK